MIATILFLTLSTSAPALAQTCYVERNGDIVDLGSMCESFEDRSQPAASPATPPPTTAPTQGSSRFVRNVAQTPFPSYLFDDNLDNEDAYLTDQMSYVNSTLFIYQGRFIKDFSQWPHTASATNHAEWSYLDCRTGWRGLDSHPMVGTSDPFFIPPAQTNNLDIYRNLCTTAGVRPAF